LEDWEPRLKAAKRSEENVVAVRTSKGKVANASKALKEGEKAEPQVNWLEAGAWVDIARPSLGTDAGGSVPCIKKTNETKHKEIVKRV